MYGNIHPADEEYKENFEELITLLGASQIEDRKKAQSCLIGIGRPAIPTLCKVLLESPPALRWQAANILGAIRDPQAASALVNALEDCTFEIRWRAAIALIQLGRDGLVPLYQALLKRFDSTQLREGAHHVLRALDKEGVLCEPSLHVLKALESIEPAIVVAWAVERALEVLISSS